MKKVYVLCVSAVILAVLSLGYASVLGGQNSFISDAAQRGMAEVELAKLAIKKSADPAVKAFAQRLITDHTVAHQDLMTLASRKEVTLPTAVSNRDKAAVDRLNALSGPAFNDEFIRQIIKDHEIAIALYRRASAMNSDQDIKDFASKALPNLEAHLQTARSMNKTPANIKSNSNKSFKPSLGGTSPNTNTIIITNASNMAGHPNHPNANAHRNVNSNASVNANR
jgi:putative membrane protein